MGVTIKQEGSGYLVEWDDLGVSCRVKDVSKGGEKAQCGWKLNGLTVTKNYPNLKSVTGMDQLAKRLEKRRPRADYGIDWEQCVEDLAAIVIDTYNKGVPEVRLADVEIDESSMWRVDNLLVQNHPNLLWADGGTGKSMFALFLGVLIQQGYTDTDHNLVVEPGNVLYLDYETDEQEIAKRSRMIHKGLGMVPESQIVYQNMTTSLVDGEDRLRDLIFNHKIEVMIVDSMGMAVKGELEQQDAVTNFFAVLRRLGNMGITSLVISHSNRAGQVFGSAFTHHWSRFIWEAKKSSSSPSGMDFTLFNRKANNVGMQPSQTWGVDFTDDSVVYTRGDTFMTDLKGELSYAQLVFKIIESEGAKTAEQLKEQIASLKADPVDRAHSNVSTEISKAKKKGTLVETETGLLELSGRVNRDQGDQSEWSDI